MKIVPSQCKRIGVREEIEFIMSKSLENTDDSVVASPFYRDDQGSIFGHLS